MTDAIIPIVAILLLVTINGLFVAAEFALVGARRSRIQGMAENGDGAASWLLRLFDREAGKDSYIAIAQLGITLASIGLGMYGEPAVAHWLYRPLEYLGLSYAQSRAVGFAIALSAITFLHVVFGEMIPKAMALQSPERMSVALNPLMRLFGVLFRPMVILLNRAAFGLMRLLGIPDPGKTAMLYSSEELEIATGEVVDSGQLGDAQKRLISNIFEMEDRTVEELMTSRSRLMTISVSADANEIANLISQQTIARYPVHGASLDEVLGVLHVKDFIRTRVTQEPTRLEALVRPLPRVSAGMLAFNLMALFKKQRVQSALVVDEFGGTLGFVTMNDLVADLIDEDDEAGSTRIVSLPDGAMEVDGEVTLAELDEDFSLAVEHPEVSTVAGLFLAINGVLPAIGDAVHFKSTRFVAEEVRGMKILRVRVERRPPTH